MYIVSCFALFGRCLDVHMPQFHNYMKGGVQRQARQVVRGHWLCNFGDDRGQSQWQHTLTKMDRASMRGTCSRIWLQVVGQRCNVYNLSWKPMGTTKHVTYLCWPSLYTSTNQVCHCCHHCLRLSTHKISSHNNNGRVSSMDSELDACRARIWVFARVVISMGTELVKLVSLLSQNSSSASSVLPSAADPSGAA